MKKILAAVIAAIITLALAVSVFADYPAKPDSYVYDGAEILSDESEAEIESVSKALFVAKGVQIAVCTVDNTGEIPANTYARGVFGEWGVNGVLILAVKSTEFYYAVQSSSISDTLTDEKLSEIMNSVLEPEFAAGNYSAGFSATVKSISSFISENVKTPESKDSASNDGTTKKSGGALKVILIIVLILGVLLGGGYGLLVYLEKKQERERRMRLEERRRRLAQSGRGNYYGAPATNGRPGNAYGQSPAGRADFDREYGTSRQGDRGGDRFVYPESSPAVRTGQRGQTPAGNGGRRPASAPPRGQRVDFDREYYKGTPAGDENVDPSATREFKRN